MKYLDFNGVEHEVSMEISRSTRASSINPKIEWEEIAVVVSLDGKQITKEILDYREIKGERK